MKTLTKENFIHKWRKDWKLLYDDGKMAIVVADYKDGLDKTNLDEKCIDVGLFWSNTQHDKDNIPYPTAGSYKNIAPIRISRKFSIAILKEIVADKYCKEPTIVKDLIAHYKKDLKINPEVENV